MFDMRKQTNILPLHVLEDVALVVPGSDLEGKGGMVALQHGRVVVQDGQLTPRIAQEGVGPAWVVHVMHCGCDQGCNLIYGVQALLLTWYMWNKANDRTVPAQKQYMYIYIYVQPSHTVVWTPPNHLRASCTNK